MFLVKLFLCLLSAAESSSLSDNEDTKRIRGLSDLGLEPDSNGRDSESLVMTSTSTSARLQTPFYSTPPRQSAVFPPVGRLNNENRSGLPFQSSSYYTEYLSQLHGPDSLMLIPSTSNSPNNPSTITAHQQQLLQQQLQQQQNSRFNINPANSVGNALTVSTGISIRDESTASSIEAIRPGHLLVKSYNEDIDETAVQTASDLSWVDLVVREKKGGKVAFNFENVSNAAFFDIPNRSEEKAPDTSSTSLASSITTVSPTLNDVEAFDLPTLDTLPPAVVSTTTISAQALEDLKKSELQVSETTNGTPATPESLKLSYKEVLEKPITQITSPPNPPVSKQQLRKPSAKDMIKNPSEAKKQLNLKKKSDPIPVEKKSSRTASQNRFVQPAPQNSQSTVNRCPASSGDICKVISKSLEYRGASDRSGSDLSNVSFKSFKGSGHVEGAESGPQYPAYQQLPPNAVTYGQWASQFRMPRAYAPPAEAGPNVFMFPNIDRSDPRVLSQVKEFRKSLTLHEGKPIERCEFEDFKPNLNLFTKASASNTSKSSKKLYTDSLPIKVFDFPPMRTWIPVRCDALDIDLKVERAVEGHAGKAGGKAHVSIVYNAKNTSKKVFYIRKEYYDLEYFTNEYNFLQFAHHPHIPKPFCVEYDQSPKIVMEYVEGERVHMAFYILGQALQSKFPKDPRARWDHMSKALGRVLAKLLVTLKYIHSIGFIHADLKPENIIYNLSNGRIAIIDFDLSVSAPYAFTGRGTEATIAPETNGLLKGPVHFGIDWWAYGSTAAMMIAVALASTQYDSNDPEIDKLITYVPFKYNRSTNQYEMTPIPKVFPPVMRSFLYPFFNPDPSRRVFSEPNAYNWIRGHPMFTCVEDWKKYENLDLGVFAAHTPLQLGFKKFSKNPVLLQPLKRYSKIFTDLSNMVFNVFSISGGGKAGENLQVASRNDGKESDSSSSASSSSSDEDEEESDENDADEEEEEGEKSAARLEIFQFDDN